MYRLRSSSKILVAAFGCSVFVSPSIANLRVCWQRSIIQHTGIILYRYITDFVSNKHSLNDEYKTSTFAYLEGQRNPASTISAPTTAFEIGRNLTSIHQVAEKELEEARKEKLAAEKMEEDILNAYLGVMNFHRA